MKKNLCKVLAVGASLSVGLVALAPSSPVYADASQSIRVAAEVTDDMVEMDREVSAASLDEIKGVFCGATSGYVTTEPTDGNVLCEIFSGQQVVILGLLSTDAGDWYRVSLSTGEGSFEGYLDAAYVYCYDRERMDEIPQLVPATTDETDEDTTEEATEYDEDTTEANDADETTEASTDEATEDSTEADIPQATSETYENNTTRPDEIEALPETEVECQTANNFEASIAAFPESYKPALRSMHAAHPNWVFIPQLTGVDWGTFISNEMIQDRSLVPRSMDDAYKGKQSWAYNASTGEYIGRSGYNWVQASQTAVEYYADPRNGLSDERVFEFELLTYNSTYQTEAGVEAILSGTFMSHAMMPDDVVCYARGFCNAGQQVNVSSYMLAARVRQEQGAAGTSPLISGTYPGYEGLYNFFNIGAYGETETEIYVNGLNRARSETWTTRYRSIAGGASILGANYISKGQDTLYLQKFDVDGAYYGMFYHQYMQNILGAYNEGNTAYRVYSSMGILNNSFVFKIPVYNNMPSVACPQPDRHANPAEVEAFVERLYTCILGRSSDASGKAYWSNCMINGGESAASVASRFVFSTEFENQKVSDSEYVERLYRTMMNRQSDASGKAYWLQALDDGCSRRYVLSKFVSSQEFTNVCNVFGVQKGSVSLKEARDQYPGATKFVTRLYRTTLHREPDVEGLNFWTKRIGSGANSPYDVAEMIVKSQEFKNYNYSNDQYVKILYRAFLNREPDTNGFNYWKNQLASGTSRESILRGFAHSEEFRKLAASYGL